MGESRGAAHAVRNFCRADVGDLIKILDRIRGKRANHLGERAFFRLTTRSFRRLTVVSQSNSFLRTGKGGSVVTISSQFERKTPHCYR